MSVLERTLKMIDGRTPTLTLKLGVPEDYTRPSQVRCNNEPGNSVPWRTIKVTDGYEIGTSYFWASRCLNHLATNNPAIKLYNPYIATVMERRPLTFLIKHEICSMEMSIHPKQCDQREMRHVSDEKLVFTRNKVCGRNKPKWGDRYCRFDRPEQQISTPR